MARAKLLVIAVAVLLAELPAWFHVFAQEDMTKKRIAFMRANYDDVKAIKRAIAEKNYSIVELKAKDIMGSMDRTLDYFPKGSLGEKSRAKAEIWDKWDEFSKLPVKVKEVASGLAKAAAAKDDAGIQAQFNALARDGSPYREGACAECHKTFFNNPSAVKKSDS